MAYNVSKHYAIMDLKIIKGSMKKLAIIVPYRKREAHLKEFIPFIESYLAEEEVPFEILIIEQADGKPFNRAKLLNIGFAESNADYFAFHDVDMLPMDSDYSFPDGPTHLASQVEQFGWGLPYDGYFGGVTLFDRENFNKINGFANEYWGWGAEDDDLLHRCLIKGVGIFRKECKYKSLSHERSIESNFYGANLAKLSTFKTSPNPDILIKADGLSTLKYQKISEEILSQKTKLIKVEL